MPYAKLSITIPESVWVSEVTRAYPHTTFRVVAATANDDAGVARIEIRGDEHATVCEEIRTYEAVTDVTTLETDAGLCSVQVETTDPLMLTMLQDSGVPLELPFEVTDGELVLEVMAPHRTLSELGDTLDEFGIQYSVERIQHDVELETLLTDRQRWVLDAAINRGYYDTPRRTTLVDLAADLDIAKSTCSEILHRAEERVLKAYRSDDRASATAVALLSD